MLIGYVANTKKRNNKKLVIRKWHSIRSAFFNIKNYLYRRVKAGKGCKMGDFKPIETQEQLDSIIGERIKEVRTKAEEKYAGYLSPEDVTKKYEGYLSPDEVTEKYKGYLSPDEVAVKDAKIKGYESHSVKTRIAHELGLSYDAVDFLKGDDEESIRKSAEILKGLVGNKQAPPLANPEGNQGSSVDASLRNMVKNLGTK